MELAQLIRDLAIIMGVAALVTLLFQMIRKPVVLGYVAAGFLVGPNAFRGGLVRDIASIHTLADLGVIFLMFSLGLEFSFRKLARVGFSSVITAILETSLIFICGSFVGRKLGMNTTESVFLGGILAISSTTVIVKSLEELNLKTRRFAEMILGVLIVEDLVAILLLVALTSVGTAGEFSSLELAKSGGKLLFVIGAWFAVGYFVIPRLARFVGKVGSDETLTIMAIGLCLLLVVLAAELRYSVALGAFIMGSLLAESTESQRIEELIRPLRDIFAAVFFVSVGMLFNPMALAQNWQLVLGLTAFLIAGKVIFPMLGALLTGQTLRTSVQVGFGLAQIGEFSFIIAGLGRGLGATSEVLYPVTVSVSILSTLFTPFFIRSSHRWAVGLENALPLSLKHALVRYSVWAQSRRASPEMRAEFYNRVIKWGMNAVMVGVVFVCVAEFGLPFARQFVRDSGLPWLQEALTRRPLAFLSAGVSFFLAAPFVWGLFAAFRGYTYASFFSRVLAGLLLGALSLEFMSMRSAMLLTGILVGAFCAIFYRRLEATYHWLEQSFLATFSSQTKSEKRADILRSLAPWDAHLVRLKVHPNSAIAGRKLMETELRARHGLNVVVINRGVKTIVSPDPSEWVYPKDELLVLGTDDQIETARKLIEKPPGLAQRYSHLSGYEMRAVRIDAESAFVGKSIREAGFREKFGAMVVGLERELERQINPGSEMVLAAGDTLWVVGEGEKLKEI